MKRLTLLFLLLSQMTFAQSNLLNQTIKKIDFQQDTVEAVFAWIADNIRYDVKEATKLKKAPASKRSSSEFKTLEEKRIHSVETALKYKKGVCEEYAALFTALVRELGYESYIVEGYTKKVNGNLNRSVGHAWNVVKVNGKWKLYDPTWGAGSVIEGKRFKKEYKEQWYDVDPEEMIKTHMPFDPIWQLREPMRYEDFENNKLNSSPEKNFDFNSLIATHVKQDPKTQMEGKLQRSIAMGNGTSLLKRWRKFLSGNISHHGVNSKVDLLNEANDKFAVGVKLFNDFIAAQRKQFKGDKHSIRVCNKKLAQAKLEVESAQKVYLGVEVDDRKRKKAIDQAVARSKKLLVDINRAQIYLSKQKGDK